jgi:uncharacterized protein with GYD domain
MAKFLIQATYSPDGLKGLMRDKASGRKAAVTKAMAAAGGTLEAFYFAFGDYDAVLIVDVPDNVTAASVAVTVSSSGLARTRMTPLLTIEEADAALAMSVDYRPPGA